MKKQPKRKPRRKRLDINFDQPWMSKKGWTTIEGLDCPECGAPLRVRTGQDKLTKGVQKKIGAPVRKVVEEICTKCGHHREEGETK